MKTELQLFYKQGDKIMLMVILFLFAFSLALASWHDTWVEVFTIGLAATVIPISLISLSPGSLLTRLAVAGSFMAFSALQIQQAHGVVELHFGIFVLLAFLLYYRDWRVIILAAAMIAGHHVLFNYLQGAQYPIYIFSGGASWVMVFTHAAYVIFESVLLVYMSLQSAKEMVRNIELQDISKHFSTSHKMIDLRYRQLNPQSQFATDYNDFMQAVNGAISNSQESADNLSIISAQLQSLSMNAQSRTQQQGNNTAFVVSAVDEIASTIQSVAQNSSDAASAAKQADQLIIDGAAVVSQTMTVLDQLATSVDDSSAVIQRLESHTEKIGAVLDVIKGIADQTNLLALNAAIEAARAGEQGRGFAVVADEVRTLASRTQKSTEEINDMIEGLQDEAANAVKAMKIGREQAHEGVKQVSQTNAVFGSITESVVIISEMSSQIAVAGEQQKVVIDEIQRNINEIASISSDTMGDSDAIAGFCQELVSSSNQLKQLVDRFST